ncbi:aldehyde dehydrogenase family protein [Ilumatobacter sp.]|uniref:aldehyde dehydrogenase family protein n=1 Tax=Ilumatobacter sp. TaxID=1967498 RepID=UPI003B525562
MSAANDHVTGSGAEFDAGAIVQHVRDGFDRRTTRPLSWRREQLRAIEAMLRDHADEFTTALHDDLRKPRTEAWTTEIGFTLADVDHQLDHLDEWTSPRKVKVPLVFRPASARIVPEPKGVVLVIAPWNYPLQLLLSPLAAAIAAGNAVVAKPSELAPATSAALVARCAEYLDTSTVAVVGGGVDESSALLEQRFDHIFFTGGTRVGKIVMRAAAEHLTPVTLELGGKSPAIVAADADIEVAGRRIAWGKFVNAGQTCIAPDHVLVERSVRDRLVASIEDAVRDFYGADPQTSDDYGRMVSDDHFDRVVALLDDVDSGAADDIDIDMDSGSGRGRGCGGGVAGTADDTAADPVSSDAGDAADPDVTGVPAEQTFGGAGSARKGSAAGATAATARSGLAFGGGSERADRYIAPTVIVDPPLESASMEEEIFGPILPVLSVDDVDAAIDFVNERPKPLALYVFSGDDEVADRVVRRTSSGGVSVNGTLMHIGPPELPFGGVGPSGMGAYHGEAGFETFSHMKSVFDRRTFPDPSMLYPPYASWKEWLIKRVQ